MSMFNRQSSQHDPIDEISLQLILRRVYLWMGLGMLLSAIIADITVHSPMMRLSRNPLDLLVTIIAEFCLALGITFSVKRLSSVVATALFFAFAALNGFTLTLILLAFRIGTVFSAFIAIAVLFGMMFVISRVARLDLTNMGTYLIMGIVGLVLAIAVSLFMNTRPLSMLISMVGVLIFTALTAYDTQRLGQMVVETPKQGDTAAMLGIFGALRLYLLDFIDGFLFTVCQLGNRLRR